MIELFYWPTPNGHKITIFLEETGTLYKITPVNIGIGDQFSSEFLKIAPNNRMPAVIDHQPTDRGSPISVFESGAILMYLSEKTGHFLPAATRERLEAIQWLFWQVANLGPMAGQNHHFRNYADEKLEYAVSRYVNETNRLYGVLDERLETREYIAGGYSIADMATYPWIVPHGNQGQDLEEFPNVKRWFESIGARAAVKRAYELGPKFRKEEGMSPEAKKILFGQRSRRRKTK